jgi:hypothetical protein
MGRAGAVKRSPARSRLAIQRGSKLLYSEGISSLLRHQPTNVDGESVTLTYRRKIFNDTLTS